MECHSHGRHYQRQEERAAETDVLSACRSKVRELHCKVQSEGGAQSMLPIQTQVAASWPWRRWTPRSLGLGLGHVDLERRLAEGWIGKPS